MEATYTKKEAYFKHWCSYVKPLGINPYLQHESFANKLIAATGFGVRVRTDFYGRGHIVTVSQVQTALRVVGQTCELDLGHNPLYKAHERYLKPIELMCAGFSRNEPIPVPEIAVPASVPKRCAEYGAENDAT